MDLTIYVGRMVSSGELNVDVDDAGKDRFTVDVETVNGVEWNRWDWINNDRPADGMLTVKDGQDHTDLVGQEVKLLTGDKIDEVFGVYATGTSQVVEATMDQIDVENDGDDLKIGDDSYDVDGAQVYLDLEENPYSVQDVFTLNGEKTADTVKMIDYDNDDDIDTILVNTVSMSRVSYVGSSSITLSAVGASNMRDQHGNVLRDGEVIDLDDNTVYEDVARDDYAVVTINDYDGSWNVAEATLVTGTVNGKVDDERRVRVDGEWYTLANNAVGAQNDNSDLYVINGSRTDFVNRDEINLYVVGNIAYYAEAVRGNDVNRAVLMVYDTQDDPDEWSNHDQVKAIFPNGNKATITLDEVDGQAITSNHPSNDVNVEVGALYTYTVNNDDEYILTSVSVDNDAGYEFVVLDGDGIDDEDTYGGATIADDAIVFAMVGDDDAKVYTGKTIIDAKLAANETNTSNGIALQDEDNGFKYTRMMNIKLDVEIDTNTEYGYLVSDAVWSYNEDLGRWVMEYSFWNGKEIVDKIELTSANKENWAVKHAIIAYTVDGDNISDVNDADVEYAAMLGYSNGRVSLKDVLDNDRVVADVDSDTLTYYVDSHASSEAGIGQTGIDGWNFIAKTKDGDENERYVNVAYILDNDGKDVKFMVIDTDGELKAPANDKYELVDETVIVDESNEWTIETNDSMTSAALVEAIEDAAAAQVSRIVVKGDATLNEELNVPAGKQLVFEDELTLNNGAVINGNITVEKIAGVTATAKLNGTMTITGTQDVDLANLTSDGSAEIVLVNPASAQTKFYEGTQAAAVAVTAPETGSYTYTTNINSSVNGWLKAAVLGETGVMETANAKADVEAMLAVYNTVEIKDETDDLGAVNIPANKTLIISDTNADRTHLDQIVGGTNSKLVFKGGLDNINANTYYFGTSATPIRQGSDLPAGAEFTYTGNKWVLSNQIDSISVGADEAVTQNVFEEAIAASTTKTVYVDDAADLTSRLMVDAGETLVIETATAAPAQSIKGEGTVVVKANVNLTNIATNTIEIDAAAGISAGSLTMVNNTGLVKTIKLGAPVSSMTDDYTVFYSDLNVAYDAATAPIGTYVYNANVLGSDPATPGFVLE